MTGSSSVLTEHWLNGEHGQVRSWQATQPHGLPLLLIHGYGALIEHWQRVLPLLAQAHTPCAFDLYNFGYSARLRATPDKDIWAAQAAQVIEQVFAAPVVVVGHSMGGMIAAHLAYCFPYLVRGLVLVNSAGLPLVRPVTPLEQHLLGMTFDMTNLPGLNEMLTGMSAMAASFAVYQGLLSSYHRKDRVTPDLVEAFSAPLRQPGSAQAYLAVSRAFDSFVLDIQPGEVQVPTLVVWGREDYAMPPSLAESFKQRMFPQADIHIIPETGHSPFDEAPEAFCAMLLPWLDQFSRH